VAEGVKREEKKLVGSVEGEGEDEAVEMRMLRVMR
jgi:hypothetical protein